MHTLTIELADDLALRLQAVSAARHVQPSEIVSESLARTLPAAPAATSSALDALQDLVACFDSGVTDLASHPRHLEGLGQWKK